MCWSEGERDMALEAVVYPQILQDPFGYGVKDLYHNNLFSGATNWGYENLLSLENEQNQKGEGSISFVENKTALSYDHLNELHNISNELSSEGTTHFSNTQNLDNSTSTSYRPKRRRARSRKNKEEIENQRMTHIAVERNRRKQMNEYLSVIKTLMPESYVQRGDQASIIGGAINFVKELEHKLQFIDSQKETEGKSDVVDANIPFSEFFTFPQYSTSASGCDNSVDSNEQVCKVQFGIADIEVTMVESHANLKIRSKKRPKQLLKIVSDLHTMRLTILHLNVTTTGEIILYSLSVKVEDDCKLGSVDDIAAAVNQILDRIQQEAMLN
ncbi:hypothetical protein Lal_00048846 [Lupinus albus]|uniref:Putative transcription factor bHLH family n=1 Tax=Lupinus albus TaxID=3870 RepID=A0A6A4QD67_LUPAL|nr:putative transcription factor bHLH family [Lupinus albus]KAF1880211.1 hypothetical protein Lal_00048846 [Lupinus albus]